MVQNLLFAGSQLRARAALADPLAATEDCRLSASCGWATVPNQRTEERATAAQGKLTGSWPGGMEYWCSDVSTNIAIYHWYNLYFTQFCMHGKRSDCIHYSVYIRLQCMCFPCTKIQYDFVFFINFFLNSMSNRSSAHVQEFTFTCLLPLPPNFK